jgi:hypothetical protein
MDSTAGTDVDMDVSIDEKLKKFEAIIDRNDPEQVSMLEDMRKHTALLHRARGDWSDDRHRTFRTYNDPGTKYAAKRLPMESESYRLYKNHVAEESQSLLSIARGEEIPRIAAPTKETDVSKPRSTLETNA